EIHAQHLRRQPIAGELDNVLGRVPTLKWGLGIRKDASHDLLHMLEKELVEFNFAYAAFPACPAWFFVNVIAQDGCNETSLLGYYYVPPEQVASFGDSHSGVTFLRLAGTGVAMGNAPDEVRTVARYVTKTAWEEGVAYALARLI